MKIKTSAIILAVVLLIITLSGCAASLEKNTENQNAENIRIGITIQSLKNAYWAGVMRRLKTLMDEKGYRYTLLDCDDNAATQISQIENFIIGGCDLIMVHPANPDSIEFVCREAMEAGIKVMCWDDLMENTTANWVLDNRELGENIGELTADFINRHYTPEHPAQVVVIGYPSTPVLLQRENGITAGLEKYCNPGCYKIVSTIEGLEANQAQSNCESALQAHPDAGIFVGIGAGAMLGANEALISLYGKNKIPEDCGVFGTDVTMEQLNALKSGSEAIRGFIGFEGSSLDTAIACLSMYEEILNDEDFSGDKKNVYRTTGPITADMVNEIIPGM